MIISRTPFRISFFGGGTDYPHWFRRHGGAVLSATIDKYCYLSCRRLPPFFPHRHRIVYSQMENVQRFEDIRHPAARAILLHLKPEHGLEIHHDADLPARSGIGSSSAFTVGLLHAVHALAGRAPAAEALAREAIYVEHELLGETVGCQDQYAVAFGGLNRILFHRDGAITVTPLELEPVRRQELEAHLLLVYSGVTRTASNVAARYVGDFDRRSAELDGLRSLVEQAIDTLLGRAPIERFGAHLHAAWCLKRALGEVISTPALDALYDRARAAGAWGGKLLGAGGGGFMVLCAPPERHAAVLASLPPGSVHVPFAFSRRGSEIIFAEHHP